MIARIWRGAVRSGDSDAYTEYMQRTGIPDYAATDGNRGAWMLTREVGELTEVVTFTLWDSLDAVKRFAGDEYETARFYPEDYRFLVERDLVARHLHRPPGGSSLMMALVRDGRRNPPLALQQVAEPQPGPREALVEVRASSVNRGELALLARATMVGAPVRTLPAS